MASVHPSLSRAEMHQIVLPTYTNNLGSIFGGQIAAWCDICAAISAQRFSRGAVTTASMDQLHFLKPVKRGMIVVLRSQVNQSWSSSLEVGVRVEAEDPDTGESVHCCTAYLTFVALDEQGLPRKVPAVETGEDPLLQRRAREAQARRELRLKTREQRRLEAR